MVQDLEKILEFKMTELESKAYKLALIWEELVKTELPKHKIVTSLKKKGDPRKSTLFKYTYKLATETNGLLPDAEYRLYITAQLQILKAITDGKVHARISPECIVGDKAWRRWKLWKSRYDKIVEAKKPEVANLSASDSKIIAEINRTKDFLVKQFGHPPTQDDITRSIKEKFMVKWISINKVCPYYAILSPFLKSALNGKPIEHVFLFDLTIYQTSLNDAIISHFRDVFSHEFA